MVTVCKELVTKIPVITRQPRNVQQICVKSRHRKHTTRSMKQTIPELCLNIHKLLQIIYINNFFNRFLVKYKDFLRPIIKYEEKNI